MILHILDAANLRYSLEDFTRFIALSGYSAHQGYVPCIYSAVKVVEYGVVSVTLYRSADFLG